MSGFIGLYHRAFFGFEFREDGLSFSPYVPKELKGERSLMGFPYRNMKLNISVSGYGDEVKEFVLDGKRQKNAFVPADLEGEHSVEIKMGGRTDKSYTILHDNVPVVQTADTSYVLPQAAEGEWQVLAVDAAGNEGFTSAPVRIYSEENVVPVNVKINEQKGLQVTVQVEIAEDGEYALDWCYSNGHWNEKSSNKCSVRTLYVDGIEKGVSVFPQLAKDDWEITGWSNAVKMNLAAGSHTVQLMYLDTNVNMNKDTDYAIVRDFRITRCL